MCADGICVAAVPKGTKHNTTYIHTYIKDTGRWDKQTGNTQTRLQKPLPSLGSRPDAGPPFWAFLLLLYPPLFPPTAGIVADNLSLCILPIVCRQQHTFSPSRVSPPASQPATRRACLASWLSLPRAPSAQTHAECLSWMNGVLSARKGETSALFSTCMTDWLTEELTDGETD